MTCRESASCGFDIVTDIAGIMRCVHQQRCEWESSVKMLMSKEASPKPTGGYEIHITIHPPKKHPKPRKSKR